MSFQIQFRGEFGGMSTLAWRPAVTGTLNQTNEGDEVASTFASREEAERVLDEVVRPEVRGAGDAIDLGQVTFRVVEVE